MRERLLLVIMIDALGHRIVEESGRFDYLAAPDGPVRAVCGYSSACIPTLLTGAPPRTHGHWAMYLRNRRQSPFRPFAPLLRLGQRLGRHYRLRRLMTRWVQLRGVRGYFDLYQVPLHLLPQFALCEPDDIFAADGLPGFDTPATAAERLGLPYRVWQWRLEETARRRALEAALEQGDAGLLFFYSPQLDAVMHAHGTRGAAVAACLDDFDAWVRRCLDLAARRYRDVRLLVFGDHGMTDVTAVDDLLPELEALAPRMPGDYLYFVDSTMARFWFDRPGVRAQVEALLASKPYGRLLAAEEQARLGLDFDDDRYGETVFLMNPGRVLAPSFMGPTAPRGMHGYHPDHADSSTILLSNFAHRPVQTIADIGPLIVRELEELAARRRAGLSGESG